MQIFLLCQYVDDLLIGASSPEEMVEHLCVLFERLNKYNLKIQLTKSKKITNKLKILGAIFSKQGRTIDPEKIAAINNFPMPTTLKGLQSFLGTLAYCCIHKQKESSRSIHRLLLTKVSGKQ